MTPEQRAHQIVLRYARDAYLDDLESLSSVPIDPTCPGCGRDLDGCPHPLCARYLAENEA